MKAVEFSALIEPDLRLAVPKEVASAVVPGQMLRVLLLFPDGDLDDPDEEQDWRRLGMEQFLKDEPPEDSIYDNL